jgi:general secretion pathway protein M
MKENLQKAWQSRSPRDRMIITAFLVALGAALYVWLMLSGGQARLHLRISVMALRAQTEYLNQQASEYNRLRVTPLPAQSPTDLRTLVQSRIADTVLARSLVRIDASDADQVVVVFDALAFTDWLKWINSLKSQRVRVDSCRIEALATTGLVGVTATLVRAKAQ